VEGAAPYRALPSLTNLFLNGCLGAFYRRLRSRLGAPKAMTATAHKLARMFYRLWTTGASYCDPGVDYYEQKYQNLMLKKLQKKAESLGLELVPKSTLPADVS
jgi:hypothetical protein